MRRRKRRRKRKKDRDLLLSHREDLIYGAWKMGGKMPLYKKGDEKFILLQQVWTAKNLHVTVYGVSTWGEEREREKLLTKKSNPQTTLPFRAADGPKSGDNGSYNLPSSSPLYNPFLSFSLSPQSKIFSCVWMRQWNKRRSLVSWEERKWKDRHVKKWVRLFFFKCVKFSAISFLSYSHVCVLENTGCVRMSRILSTEYPSRQALHINSDTMLKKNVWRTKWLGRTMLQSCFCSWTASKIFSLGAQSEKRVWLTCDVLTLSTKVYGPKGSLLVGFIQSLAFVLL